MYIWNEATAINILIYSEGMTIVTIPENMLVDTSTPVWTALHRWHLVDSTSFPNGDVSLFFLGDRDRLNHRYDMIWICPKLG